MAEKIAYLDAEFDKCVKNYVRTAITMALRIFGCALIMGALVENLVPDEAKWQILIVMTLVLVVCGLLLYRKQQKKILLVFRRKKDTVEAEITALLFRDLRDSRRKT